MNTIRFGCKKCTSPHVREENRKLICISCGFITERDVESTEERDARILYLSRFDAAERLLNMSPPRFDDAEDHYTEFIRQYPTNSDGYWGRVRAKYGIKYEDDISGKKIPSCYKSSYDDFREDEDFIKALQLAESNRLRETYQREAESIAGVCKEWREEASRYHYDIFISFKATDDVNAEETRDSREMLMLYTYLQERGYRVFFSPMSMKMYTGKHYDAYIFNALQTSRAMIVYGSKAEYFSATWVKNEWTRYLRLQARGAKPEGSCIVACDGVDPYALPRELRCIQAINASKDNRSFYIDVNNTLDRIFKQEKKEETHLQDGRFADQQALLQQVEELKKALETQGKEEAKRKAEEEAKRKAEEEAKRQAEEEAKRKAEEEAKRKAEEEAKRKAEEEAKRKAEEEAKRKAEEEAKRKAENDFVVWKNWRENKAKLEQTLGNIHNVYGQSAATAEDPKKISNEANQCYTSGDYAKAAELYRKAADLGYAIAQYNLGVCYENGRGVTRNYAEAVKWYTKAAEQGDVQAQRNLGVCYRDGQGVTQSYAEAVKWFTKAAEQGYAQAQFNLGVCYYIGQGVTQNYAEAVKWYTKAAEQGHAEAQDDLGNCYRFGRGVSKNYQEAVKWYTKAAEQRNKWAQESLGDCYYYGLGVSQSFTEAVKWYTKAAEQGLSYAQYRLGYCYYYKRGVSRNYKEAVKWYTKAADGGNKDAQYSLAQCYEQGKGVFWSRVKAAHWYTKAAERGCVEAQCALGTCYEKGRGVSKSYAEALKWYRLAAEQNHAHAKYCLGRCYEKGKGVLRSNLTALNWYTQAAKQGHVQAEKAGKRLKRWLEKQKVPCV